MTQTALIQWIALAIGSMEGYFVTPEQWRKMKRAFPAGWKEGDPISRAQINRNPGNLRSWGAVPIVKGYACFPTAEKGWNALRAQAKKNIYGGGAGDLYPLRKNGLTFREFFAGQRGSRGDAVAGGYPGYAPAKDANQPAHYAEYVLAYIKARGFSGSSNLSLLSTASIDTHIRNLEAV
jgi:hypothetical protein